MALSADDERVGAAGGVIHVARSLGTVQRGVASGMGTRKSWGIVRSGAGADEVLTPSSACGPRSSPSSSASSSGAASAAPLAPPLEGLEVPRRDHGVARLRVMEDERRHRRLGVHHVALGETHADGALHVEGAEELL